MQVIGDQAVTIYRQRTLIADLVQERDALRQQIQDQVRAAQERVRAGLGAMTGLQVRPDQLQAVVEVALAQTMGQRLELLVG